MITAENAVLRIKHIRQSRNGPFCGAALTTDFGEFKVKDAILEQFEEGEYEATVWISEIYLGQYIAYGKAVTEIRARLHDLQVHTEDQRQLAAEPVELEPLDEPAPPRATASAAAAAQEASGSRPASALANLKKKLAGVASASSCAGTAQASAIYDSEMLQAIEQGEPIKLDLTIDRTILREQTADLKARGYRFDSKQQTWFAP